MGISDQAKPGTAWSAGGWRCAIAIFLLIFGIWIADKGGIFQNLGQNLGLSNTLIEVYNQNAATNHVYAEIEGFWESDRTSANGKYLILGNEGKEFIVTDGEGVYKTGAQIITSKVKTVIGGESENIIKTLSFNDEQAIDKLNELKEKYPANLIVVSGELTTLISQSKAPQQINLKFHGA